ncbi:MAG: hypothetical protein WCT42_00435 [Candidatus Paceibacterota bacterium]
MKIIKIKFFLVWVFIFGIICIPSFSFAEMQIEVQSDEVNIEMSPRNPQPYDDVTITLSSYATDLNKAIIVWKTGSSTVLSGIGKTSYSFKASGPNTTNFFDISITPVGSMSNINKKISITPSEIEIMWESVNGYTPPFYRGKSLPSSGSFIKAVAIPNTNTIKSGSGSITYNWKNNDSAEVDSSGYNKNSYIFKNNMFDNKNEISVVASSVDGKYSAENSIQIPTYKPKIIFYKKSPTEGILYNNALDKEAYMSEEEMTILAEPYFLTLQNNENDLTYSWQINGEKIVTPSKKNELTVRPTSRGGYATINLIIENVNELFQEVSNQLKLNL